MFCWHLSLIARFFFVRVLEEQADRSRSEVELMKTALKTKDEMISVLAESNGGIADAEG